MYAVPLLEKIRTREAVGLASFWPTAIRHCVPLCDQSDPVLGGDQFRYFDVINFVSLPNLVVGMHPCASCIVACLLQETLAVDATQQPHSTLSDFVGHEEELVDGFLCMAGRDLSGVVFAGRHFPLHRFDPDSTVHGRHEVRLTSCIVKHPLKTLDTFVLEPRVENHLAQVADPLRILLIMGGDSADRGHPQSANFLVT